MQSLPLNSLGPDWNDFLQSLIKDLGPLGHYLIPSEDGLTYTFGSHSPEIRDGNKSFWQPLHQRRHLKLLKDHVEWILAFENAYRDIFCDMQHFEPSSVSPTIEIVDFENNEHNDIVEYIRLSQSVTSSRLVGRRMGLLIWDDGQSGRRPLIGGALLASTMYSQPIRDRFLSWPPSLAKKHPKYDADTRAIREFGLDRIMQLSISCALQPYQRLKAAKLVSLAPFTAYGQTAFQKACRNKDDPDLAAIITTTGQDVTGTPFQNHRVSQLTKGKIPAAHGAKGNVYRRMKPSEATPPLRAQFRELVSEETRMRSLDLFQQNCPKRFLRANNKERSAMNYTTKRLGLPADLFDGNTMGVHMGALGAKTINYLSTGDVRPKSDRHLLEWTNCVSVWAGAFMPVQAGETDPAQPETIEARNQARRRRADDARQVAQADCFVSNLVNRYSQSS